MGRNLSFSAKAALATLLVSWLAAPALAQAPNPRPEAAPRLAPAKPPAGPGASLLPGAASHEPINIAADKLDYFDKEQKLVYSGNVVAVQGDTRLNAAVLTILLDKKGGGGAAAANGPGGGSQVRRMEGKGPIAITSKDQIGTGDALVYDKPENKFYLIGHVALSQGENVTRGEKLIYDLTTGQAVVSSTGRVHSLIVPGDKGPKAAPAASAAPKPLH